jgi:hypothetical protein
MNDLIRRGPITFVLVYSTTCPHCHTYMPTWKSLCAMKDKRANMVSMEADTYMGTQMSAKKSVEGVPTVLYVSPSGEISEVSSPRDTATMTTAVKEGVSEAAAKSMNMSASASSPLSASPTMTPSRLNSIPATPLSSATMEQRLLQTGGGNLIEVRQTGGNPWGAFLMAAQQAAPAAALLGAYTMMKKPVRSSGLGAPRRTRRHRRR